MGKVASFVHPPRLSPCFCLRIPVTGCELTGDRDRPPETGRRPAATGSTDADRTSHRVGRSCRPDRLAETGHRRPGRPRLPTGGRIPRYHLRSTDLHYPTCAPGKVSGEPRFPVSPEAGFWHPLLCCITATQDALCCTKAGPCDTIWQSEGRSLPVSGLPTLPWCTPCYWEPWKTWGYGSLLAYAVRAPWERPGERKCDLLALSMAAFGGFLGSKSHRKHGVMAPESRQFRSVMSRTLQEATRAIGLGEEW